jgi:methanogenic corrinoid protein MtbC1
MNVQKGKDAATLLIRDKYLVMIGGAPTSQKWADDIGADIYGENAERAVSLALEFMSKNQSGIS